MTYKVSEGSVTSSADLARVGAMKRLGLNPNARYGAPALHGLSLRRNLDGFPRKMQTGESGDPPIDMYVDCLPRPIRLNDASEAAEGIKLVHRNWPIRESVKTDVDPIITVSGLESGFSLNSPWLEQIFVASDVAHIVCSLSSQLYFPMMPANPANLICHGAGALIDGRLVMFPATYRSGKTLLMVQLAYAGFRVFADDVFFVSMETGEAIATGVLPRLRWPLPNNVSAEFKNWVDERTVLAGKRYRYVDLSDEELCPYGERHRISGFMALRLQEHGEPQLANYRSSHALHHLIWQNAARARDASDILDRLWSIVPGCWRSTLTYSNGEDVADLLREQSFSDRAEPDLVTPPIRHQSAADDARTSRCNPEVVERLLDGCAFLANNQTQRILRLNETGTGVWRLLAEGADRDEIMAVTSAAFPDVDRSTIAEYVGVVLTKLDEYQCMRTPDQEWEFRL